MYLSRIEINPYLPEARKVLADTRELHIAVMRMFKGYHLDKTGRTTNRRNGSGSPLWRLDSSRDSLSLFVLSGDSPDTSVLARDIGWDDAVTTMDYTPLLSSIRDGQVFQFRTTVNMTTRNGKIAKAVTSPNGKLVWLAERSRVSGFHVNSLPVVESMVDEFKKTDENDEMITVTLDKTTVNGTLTVTNADDFRRALTSGFGRGRAYGCGLLTLAPAE